MKMLYEGKAKQIYYTEHPEEVLVYYKDDATAFNGEKKGTILGKGQVNAEMSALLFQHLEAEGIPTHLIKTLTPGRMLVKAVTILPVEVIVRNIAAGSLSKLFWKEVTATAAALDGAGSVIVQAGSAGAPGIPAESKPCADNRGRRPEPRE